MRLTLSRWALANEAHSNLRADEKDRLHGGIDCDLAVFAAALKQDHFDAEPGRILVLNDGGAPDYHEFKNRVLSAVVGKRAEQGRAQCWLGGRIDYLFALSENVYASELDRLRAGLPDSWEQSFAA